MYRHLALYRRSWPRLLELMYWPVLQMVVWGFITAYLAGVQGNTASVAAGVLLGGVLLWEVTLRSQMGFADLLPGGSVVAQSRATCSSRRCGRWELVAGLAAMSVLRTVAAVAPAMVLAFFLYGFGVWKLGPVVVAYVFALMAMGWAVALARHRVDPAPWRGGGGAGLGRDVRHRALRGGVLPGVGAAGTGCSRSRWRSRRRMCSRACARRC